MAIKTANIRKSRIPRNSFIFEKLVPISLVILAVVTTGLMLFAAGIFLGLIQY